MRHLLLFIAMSAALGVRAQQTAGLLVADGNSADTYSLIRACGYEEEVPDNSRDHASAPFQHITQQHDAILGKPVFVFHIHAAIDDDRGLANVNDRQRNEIKTGPKSPASLIAQEGETLTMKWKFKLPAGMKTTSKFTHIHQLKGIDNKQGTADVGHPLMTLTCYTSGNRQVLRLRYEDRTARNGAEQHVSTLKETDLSPFLGEWVEAEEVARFGANGTYRIVIRRISDGKELFSYSNANLDMWRTSSAGLRPKWGIYRFIGEDRAWQNQLRDEQLLFADFSIVKGEASGLPWIETGQDTGRTPVTWNLDGSRRLADIPGIYIKSGKKYLKK